MSTYNVASVFGFVLLQAAFIRDAHGQSSTCQVLDLAFLIDGSGSICDGTPGYDSVSSPTCINWDSIVQFVYQFVASLDISPDATRVAVATFANDAQLLWNLTSYPNKTSLLNAINTTLKYPKGNTYTDKGLNLLTSQVFVPPGDRQNVNNTVIIITDGKPTNNATLPAAIQAVRNANIRSLVVGVTDSVDKDTLKSLSSDPQQENVTYFWSKDFKSIIDQVSAQLRAQACQVTIPPAQPTSTPGTISPAACQILDLAFLIDGSGSICDYTENYNFNVNSTCANWNFIVGFVSRFVESLNIAPDATRVAVATFSDNANLLWNLIQYPDKASLLNAINTMLYPKGTTHTTEGLYLLVNQVFVPPGDRPDVNNAAIIITDGKPTNLSTVPAAMEAVRNARIRTLVVGVTNNTDNNTLQLLSTDNSTYFWAKDFTTIDQVRAQLYNQACHNGNETVGLVSPSTPSPSSQAACDLMDLCFIVDRSGSICDSDPKFNYSRDDTCGNWNSTVKFIHDLVVPLSIGPSNVRVAMVIFADSAEVAWGLAKYSNKTSLLNAIDNLTYVKGGTTDTTGGLNAANTQVFNTADDRSTAGNVAIVITDGKPTVQSTVPDAVTALQGPGGDRCRMLAVGITDSIDMYNLELLASPPKKLGITIFVASNYSTVSDVSGILLSQLCPQSTTAAPPTIVSCASLQDVVIVLDGSGSICDSDEAFNFTRDDTCRNWALIRQFVHNVAENFTISPAATRVALIQFSVDARLVWGLDVYTDKTSLLYAIDNLQYMKGGTTNMTGALNVLNTQVFTPQLTRPNAKKIAIIVTDGKPTDPSTVPAAIKAVNDSGIRCLVVGVTNNTDNETLKQLSSDPKKFGETYFLATDYRTIDDQVTAQLIAQACPGTTTTPSTTTAMLTPTSPSTSSTTIKNCGTNTMLDLVFVVDGSGSICNNTWPVPPTCDNWNQIRQFISAIEQRLPIGLNQTRVGMIIFASTGRDTRVVWNLTTYTTSMDLLDQINNLPYPGGDTYTAMGLNLLLTMFVEPYDRPGVNNTAIIITDGIPTDNITTAIADVHKRGIKTFAVGITNFINADTLKELSSDPKQENVNYFMSADFNSLNTVLSGLLNQTCGP